MATIRKSKVGKYTYWQIVESKRVNGKPRPVVLAHLGTAEQLLHKLREGVFRKRISSASHSYSKRHARETDDERNSTRRNG